MDYTKIYKDDVARLLDPGERLLAVVPYRLAHGAERVERTPEVVERRLEPLPGRTRRWAGGLAARGNRPGRRSVLTRLIDADWPWTRIDWDERLGGFAVAGAPGSLAVRFADATREGVGQYGVVTDRRLAVVRKVAADRFEPVVEAPRSSVAGARRRGRPLQRGRVVIGFTDGSRLAVNSGILVTGQARRLVRGLTSQPDPEGVA